MRSRGAMFAMMVLLVLLAPFVPDRAHACSLVGNTPHTIDPAMVGVDQTPPELAQPTVSVQDLETSGACMNQCGYDHSATLSNLATDDLTPVERMGYRLTGGAGTGRVTSWSAGETVLGAADGTLTLLWTGDDAFSLQVVAIDSAGNESAPRTVIVPGEAGGCRVDGQHGNSSFASLVVALTLAGAAMRRRRGIRRTGAAGR
jgi:MYXO-CTERM domain-containing protein